MKDFVKNFVQYAATKFPSVFLDYLRDKLETSELKNSSLYEITKVAYSAHSLDELYKSIHINISKLMYAENLYIALHDKKENSITFPFYVDEFDAFKGLILPFDERSITCYCIIEEIPILFSRKELEDFEDSITSDTSEELISGTMCEYWLGCPLIVNDTTIGAIVVQSYNKKNVITNDDRDLLAFVSDLLAMVIEKKRLEHERLEYQDNLERKIDERTKELFYAKEKAESATKTKSEFLANMSHELRTPLNAIIGFCEILIEDATEIKQKGFVNDLNKIHRSGNHLLTLINDILDLSKINVKKMDVNIDSFNLQDMLKHVIETLEPYAKINNNNIRLNIPESAVTVRSDEMKIRQILFNLISNACKHSEESTIEVYVQQKLKDKNRYLSFEIKDAGEGIPKTKLEQIFEPFCQADSTDNSKLQGTGLGLTLAKGYTELLGGNITVESKEGIGSTFTSYILQDYWVSKEKKAQISFEEIRELSPSSDKEKILVIDDDIIFLDLINTRLVKEGFTVYTANSGHKGLQKAKQILPDIIILDIVMPDIDGWTVYKNLKSTPLLSEIPVVIITIGDYQKMAKDFGVLDFLSKPINWKLLSKTLEQYKTVTKSRHILVVDDDSATRIILRKMLVKDGWRVEEAIHGKEAILCIEKDKPELILLDLLMPVMDGFEFLNIVNDNDDLKEIPIIVITSKDLTEEDYSFLTTNVDQVIQKGKYTRKELIGRIDTAIKASNLKTYQKGN